MGDDMKLELKHYSLPVHDDNKIVDVVIVTRGIIDGKAVSMFIGDSDFISLVDEFYGYEKLKDAKNDSWAVYEYIKIPYDMKYKLKLNKLHFTPVWWLALCSEELKEVE